MSKVFIANSERKELREKATIQQPPYRHGSITYDNEMREYRTYIMSLTTYPAPFLTDKDNGKEFVLGIDFTYRTVRLARGSMYKLEGSDIMREAVRDNEGYYYFAALPLPPASDSKEGKELSFGSNLLAALFMKHCHPDPENNLDAYVSWEDIVIIVNKQYGITTPDSSPYPGVQEAAKAYANTFKYRGHIMKQEIANAFLAGSSHSLPEGQREAVEWIVCAANHYNDDSTYLHQPVNIKKGFVVAGRRHHNCINTFAHIAGFPYSSHWQEVHNTEEQGFLTNTNRFVDRKEAFKIAAAANQIKGPNKGQSENSIGLTSEDLY